MSTSVGRRCRDRCVSIAVLVMMVVQVAVLVSAKPGERAYQCVLH